MYVVPQNWQFCGTTKMHVTLCGLYFPTNFVTFAPPLHHLGTANTNYFDRKKVGGCLLYTCGCYLARCCLFFSNFGLVPTIKFLNSEFCPLEKKIRSCAFWGCDESQFRSYASPPQDIHSLFAVEAAQLPSALCLKTLEEDNREMFLQMRRKMYFSCKRAARIFFSVFEISRGSFGHVGMGFFPGRHYLYGQTMVAVAAGSVGVWVALFKVHTCRRPNKKLKNIICFHSTGKRKKSSFGKSNLIFRVKKHIEFFSGILSAKEMIEEAFHAKFFDLELPSLILLPEMGKEVTCNNSRPPLLG